MGNSLSTMVGRIATIRQILLTSACAVGLAGCGSESPDLGTAVLARAGDQALVVVDVGSGKVLYERPGPYLSSSVLISRDATTIVGIGADESVTRVDLESGEEEEIQPSTGARSTGNRFGRQSNWFRYATGLDEDQIVAESSNQGRTVDTSAILESATSGELAYMADVPDSPTLVVEKPDGSERVATPIEGGVSVLAFIDDSVLVNELIGGELLLRERNRQGAFVRELGAGGQIPRHFGEPVPLSQDGSRILLEGLGVLEEVELATGERRELVEPFQGGRFSADYVGEDSVVVFSVLSTGPMPSLRFTLEVVNRTGERRDLFRDRAECNGRFIVSPNDKYVAIRCGSPAVLEIYDLDSGGVVASIPEGWILDFSSNSEVAVVTTRTDEEAWLVTQTMDSSDPRRVAQIEDTGGVSTQAVDYAP